MEEAGRLPSVMTATSGRSSTGTTSSGVNQDKGHRGKGQNPLGGQKQLASAMSAQGNGTNVKCAYPPCGKPGHIEAQCWMKYPHLRPQPFVPRGNQGGGSPSGGNHMEARLAELQDTLARLVAASAQPTPWATGSRASTSNVAPRLAHDPFEYGAAGQVISAVATRSQTNVPQVPTVVVDPLGRVTQDA